MRSEAAVQREAKRTQPTATLSYPHSLPSPHYIADVPVHPLRLTQLLAWIEHIVKTGQRATVMYANAHGILLAQDDGTFRGALKQADAIFCDGYGVWGASRLLGGALPERFTPPDWIEALAAPSVRERYRLFLLGAEPGVAAAAAKRLQQDHPSLDISTHHGYFTPEGEENEEVLATINEAAPDLLLVGMGMPRQERWIIENRAQLEVPVIIAVGALFDYLAGHLPRGPHWLTGIGLEWLCRLWFEPRRLWRRYLLGLPRFGGLVMRQWWETRAGQPSV